MLPIPPVWLAWSISARIRNFSWVVNRRLCGRVDSSGSTAVGAGTTVGLRLSSELVLAAVFTISFGNFTRHLPGTLYSKLWGYPCLTHIGTEGCTTTTSLESANARLPKVSVDRVLGVEL